MWSPLSIVAVMAVAITLADAGQVAVVSTASAAPARREPPAPDGFERFYPYLEGERAGVARSIGDTSHGLLLNAVRVRESEALGILAEHRGRDLAYGTSGLVTLLEHAAASLHAATGRRLWVGNLSRDGGGDIVHSVSHNSGRDADVALCYQDAKGRPIDPTALVPIRANGRGPRGLRFDAAACWLIVRSLLTDGAAQVQYVFVSASLKRALLVHAQSIHEPAWLVRRAHEVLKQPYGSAAHDDHLHVRVYCGQGDVEAGCRNLGPASAWAALHQAAKGERLAAACDQLDAAEPRARQHAIERLVLLDARAEADRLLEALSDDCSEVRWSAALALGALGSRGHASALAVRLAGESDQDVQQALREARARLVALRRGMRPRRGPARVDAYLMRSALVTSRLRWARLRDSDAAAPALLDARDELLSAIALAPRVERIEPLRALLPLLDHRDGAVRSAAARSLASLSNYAVTLDWSRASDAEIDAAASAWRSWISRRDDHGRDALVVAGFRASRYRYEPREISSLWQLVPALVGDEHHAYNAGRVLSRWTAHEPPPFSSKLDGCSYWLEWLRAHRGGLRLAPPPREIRSACALAPG